MDKIIIINDNRIEAKLEQFILANRQHIRFISDMDEVALSHNPVLKEIIDGYEEKRKIRIKSENQIWLFRSTEIIRIQANKDNVEIHLHNKPMTTIKMSLEKLKEKLESFSFVQVHNNHIVNINYLSKIYDAHADTIELSDGCRVPVSKSYKSSVRGIFEKYLTVI